MPQYLISMLASLRLFPWSVCSTNQARPRPTCVIDSPASYRVATVALPRSRCSGPPLGWVSSLFDSHDRDQTRELAPTRARNWSPGLRKDYLPAIRQSCCFHLSHPRVSDASSRGLRTTHPGNWRYICANISKVVCIEADRSTPMIPLWRER